MVGPGILLGVEELRVLFERDGQVLNALNKNATYSKQV